MASGKTSDDDVSGKSSDDDVSGKSSDEASTAALVAWAESDAPQVRPGGRTGPYAGRTRAQLRAPSCSRRPATGIPKTNPHPGGVWIGDGLTGVVLTQVTGTITAAGYLRAPLAHRPPDQQPPRGLSPTTRDHKAARCAPSSLLRRRPGRPPARPLAAAELVDQAEPVDRPSAAPDRPADQPAERPSSTDTPLALRMRAVLLTKRATISQMENDAQDSPEAAPELAPEPARRRRGTARRAGQLLPCGWCGKAVTVRPTGRTRKWCSDACRLDAWSAARAAASGRAAVEVVDREVEIEVQVPVKVIEQVKVLVHPRGGPAWGTALRDLAAQLDNGGIADRDIPALLVSLDRVNDSLRRRPAFHLYYRLNWPPTPQ